MNRLQGKAIFVAGGGAIGDELARRYAREGASVLLGDIDVERAGRVAREIERDGAHAAAVHLDGADERSVRSAMAEARARYGGLDGLHVNFARFEGPGTDWDALELPMPEFDAIMSVNVRGFLLCTRHALPEILARNGGAILFTSSIAAYRGEPKRLAYAMSKAAILALMRHVASRYGAQGVRANAIAPGFIRRPDQEENFGPELMKWATELAQIKSRIGEPADIASLSALLMSDEGSFITGQTICVDGGITMRA